MTIQHIYIHVSHSDRQYVYMLKRERLNIIKHIGVHKLLNQEANTIRENKFFNEKLLANFNFFVFYNRHVI